MGIFKAIVYTCIISSVISVGITAYFCTRGNYGSDSTIQNLNAELNNLKGQLETSQSINRELKLENTKYADYERRYTEVERNFREYQQRIKSELELGQKEIGGIIGYQRGASNSIDDNIRILEEIGAREGISF